MNGLFQGASVEHGFVGPDYHLLTLLGADEHRQREAVFVLLGHTVVLFTVQVKAQVVLADVDGQAAGLGLAVYSHMCDSDLLDIASHRNTAVGSDGLLGREGENGHPRAFGTCIRAIRHYVYEAKIFTLEEAIRRMTAFPASRLGLAKKGLIRDGYDADLVLFDLDKLRDRADYHNSLLTCEGIRAVLVGGKTAYDGEKLTSERRGRVLDARRT